MLVPMTELSTPVPGNLPQPEPTTEPTTGPESKTEDGDSCGAKLVGGRCSRYQCDNY